MSNTTLNFTVKSSSVPGGATTACWNARLRRMSLPASFSKGVKFYTVLGAEGGADALLLTPAEAGCAVHPAQRFITVPKDLAVALKSRRYSIAGEAGGELTLTPAK